MDDLWNRQMKIRDCDSRKICVIRSVSKSSQISDGTSLVSMPADPVLHVVS